MIVSHAYSHDWMLLWRVHSRLLELSVKFNKSWFSVCVRLYGQTQFISLRQLHGIAIASADNLLLHDDLEWTLFARRNRDSSYDIYTYFQQTEWISHPIALCNRSATMRSFAADFNEFDIALDLDEQRKRCKIFVSHQSKRPIWSIDGYNYILWVLGIRCSWWW